MIIVPATPNGGLPALVMRCLMREVTERVNPKLTCNLVVKLFDYATREGFSDPRLAEKRGVTLRQFEQMKCDLVQQLGLGALLSASAPLPPVGGRNSV
jgi:hypothetical protein